MNETAQFWRNWIQGWQRCRHILNLEYFNGGCCFELRDGRREKEWLLFDPAQLAAVLPRVSHRDYLCISGIDARFSLPQGWKPMMLADMMVNEQLYAMQPKSVPENVVVDYVRSAEHCRITFKSEQGEIMCRGQVGYYNGFAVFDRINTDLAYRRQGWGSMMMNLLSQEALLNGVKTGLLCASEQGKLLYLSLGWRSIGQYLRIVRNDYTRD
ncbi:GNAT family N-acetyltransferase [Muribacter muris]|uniref:GNAT family N-acetyltransferase n=1 Tax=Muribacter muris TaxID=67855 RepID=UPI00069EFE2C|nr:GNAT family N-acetyltransferase [Muribacter muris]